MGLSSPSFRKAYNLETEHVYAHEWLCPMCLILHTFHCHFQKVFPFLKLNGLLVTFWWVYCVVTVWVGTCMHITSSLPLVHHSHCVTSLSFSCICTVHYNACAGLYVWQGGCYGWSHIYNRIKIQAKMMWCTCRFESGTCTCTVHIHA